MELKSSDLALSFFFFSTAVYECHDRCGLNLQHCYKVHFPLMEAPFLAQISGELCVPVRSKDCHAHRHSNYQTGNIY